MLLSHIVNLLVDWWLVTPEWCHIWGSVLVSTDVRHLNSAPAVAMSSMKSASLCCWTHTNISSMALWPYSSWAHWTWTWRVGKRGWQQSHSAYFSEFTFWSAFTWNISLFLPCSHLQRLFTFFFLRCLLSPIFYSNSLLISDHLAKPLDRVHQSVNC